jgi:hypothetical protein
VEGVRKPPELADGEVHPAGFDALHVALADVEAVCDLGLSQAGFTPAPLELATDGVAVKGGGRRAGHGSRYRSSVWKATVSARTGTGRSLTGASRATTAESTATV